jgi:hypothetical protein
MQYFNSRENPFLLFLFLFPFPFRMGRRPILSFFSPSSPLGRPQAEAQPGRPASLLSRGRRQVGPTCRRPGWEEGGGRPSWALAFGRPSGRRGGRRMGRWPTRKEKGEKEKEKGRKGFSLELKYCLLNFNWLKLFLGL